MPSMSPNWDYGILGFLILTISTFSGWYLRVMLPCWRDQSAARARKIDAEAELAEATKDNQRNLISLVDRNTQMHSANTQAIAELAKAAGETNQSVKQVYAHLLRGCKCEADRAAAEGMTPRPGGSSA